MNLPPPIEKGFRQPAEWAPHAATWVAWPSHADLWEEDLRSAQKEFAALCRTIAGGGAEILNVLVPGDPQESEATRALAGLTVRFHRIPFGDIWLRDTAPIFVEGLRGGVASVRFQFNGWGGKYVLPEDDRVAERIQTAAGLQSFSSSLILEGGSIDVDGEGACLTTRQCLLNPNRNPGIPQDRIEAELREKLGITDVLWLERGLQNDHTDGHVDTIARFVGPGEVVCMRPQDSSDPNGEALAEIESDLKEFRDSKGQKLKVHVVPSPGEVLDEDGELMPASYLNFYISNRTVAVPTYGARADAAATAAIAALFPGRNTVGLAAKSILTGGGAFHCITQQQPAGARK